MATTIRPVNLKSENSPMGFVETEAIRPYLLEARKYKPFNRPEEIAAVEKAIKSGKQADFDEFVNHNLLIVITMAKKYMHLGVPLGDLIQYGNIGLITAAREYMSKDLYKVNAFSSLAVWYIRKYITEGIEENQLIAKPHMVAFNSNKVKKAKEFLSCLDSDTIIENETLAEYLGMTTKEVQDAVASETSVVSADTVIGTDDDKATTLGDIMLKSDMNADKDVMEEDKKTQVEILLNRLNNREKLVVKMTYAIGYDYEHKPERIARELGLGTERVRQILKGVMSKLQNAYATC